MHACVGGLLGLLLCDLLLLLLLLLLSGLCSLLGKGFCLLLLLQTWGGGS